MKKEGADTKAGSRVSDLATTNKRLKAEITSLKKKISLLEEKSKRYNLLSTLSSCYIFEISVMPEGGYLVEWVTDGFTAITGYVLEDIRTPDKWKTIIFPGDIPILDECFKLALSGTPAECDMRLITKTGETVWINIRISPEWDAYRRNVKGIVGFGKEISKRKKAEEELRLDREVIRNMKDGVVLVKAEDGRIVYANPRFEELFGYEPGELAGQNITVVNAPTDKSPEETAREIMGALRDKGAWYGEVYNKKKDGTLFWCYASVSTFEHHKYGRIWVGIHQDITELKGKINEVQRLNEDLRRNLALLEKANKELEGFSYSVSHDLRVPLRAIDGFSSRLLDNYAGNLDDEGRRLLGVVIKSARKMGQLIDDLLDFSRAGRREMTLSMVNMERLAKSVFEELTAELGAEPPEFTTTPMSPAMADASLIRQVFTNLISNALKFTSPRARPLIEIGAWSDDGETVYYVKDNGVGFDMRYVGKLFGVFQRLHTEEQFKGTGIGLAIVQRIISRHGGRVWAEGEIDKGATFYFTIPRTTSVDSSTEE